MKNSKQHISGILLLIIFFGFYIWFANSDYFNVIFEWSKQNKLLLILSIIVIKILGIVWPPIPGAVFSLASIPLLGWKTSYIINLAGLIIGSVIAYKIAEIWGEKLIKKFIDINKVKKIKIKKGREIEVILLLTIFGSGIFFEAVCYGAGLLKIDFKKFIAGIVLGNALTGIPLYYLIGSSIKLKYSVIPILITIGVFLALYKLKGRYLE